ncbi:MAG TPA: glycosyltransferase [Gemmatimonadaceae bacterium]|nr:glycosyltransferase [Gemmatimonadaceae bacterium]
MPYAIVRVNLAAPLPALAAREGERGVALDLRWRGRPVGFLLLPFGAARAFTPEELAPIVALEAAARVVQAKLLEELAIPLPPPHELPRLTITVCTKDRPADVARWLEQVRRVRCAAGPLAERVELLVVDNAPSDDRTAELVACMPDVRYAREPRPGLDFARNRALREATGDFIAYIDDDAVVDAGWLDAFYEAWTENPDAGGITGQVLPYELATEAQLLFEERGGFRRGFEKRRYHGARMREVPWYPHGAGNFGAGANMAFRRELLLSLGGFDEALDTGAPLPGGGDLDMFYRVARAGEPMVYEPAMLVFHQHRREYAGLRRQYWSWGAGFMAFVSKHFAREPAERRRWLLILEWWARYSLRMLARGAARRGGMRVDLAAAELAGGIVGLCGTYGRSQRRSARIVAEHV